MSQPKKLFGFWILLTTAFIGVAILLSSLLTARHYYKLETESREAYRQLIQAQLFKNYQLMAEEAYLKLGANELHERDLRSIIANKGNLTLRLVEQKNSHAEHFPSATSKIRWNSHENNADSFSIPLFFGDHFLGDLEALIEWKTISLVPFAEIVILGVVLLVGWVLLAIGIKRRIVAPLLEEFIRLQRTNAIGELAQMVTHDLRRPLTTAKLLGDMLSQIHSISELKTTLRTMLPELERAIRHANGMIMDIMEMGGRNSIQLEPAHVELIIDSVLAEVIVSAKYSSIKIEYDFQHTLQLNVDTLKVTRLFANIITNALQAMNGVGTIWFRTKDCYSNGKPFLEVRIGNSGPLIPPKDIPLLFNAFFTNGKKGGTGLGLAIAEKIISSHGGKISCVSSTTKGVEFFFTLPALKGTQNLEGQILPMLGSEYLDRFLAKPNNNIETSEEDPSEQSFEKEFIDLGAQLQRKIKILIVDDEALYRNAVLALLKEHWIASLVEAKVASSYVEAKEILTVEEPDLYITDLDLGRGTPNGFDLTKEIRALGMRGEICIVSNRFLSDDSKIALQHGANAFLPKPLIKIHFLKVLINASKSVLLQKREEGGHCKKAVLIDNDEGIRLTWVYMAHKKGVSLQVFGSGAEFFQACEFVDPTVPIYVDNFLDEGARGEDLAQEIFSRGFRNIYLATGAEPSSFAPMSCIKGIIGKEPPF